MKKLDELYFEIKSLIDKVNFSILWQDFKPLKFALYNETQCFFNGEYIEKTNDFLANTSILYNGEFIAIWNVLEEMDEMILTSKIIHEMFHGFQMQMGEKRFPDELDALYHYQYCDDNLSIKYLENKMLISLLDHFKNEDYEMFLKYRKYRFDHFPYEYRYESSIEQIEGTANFIELNVLKQLSYELYLKKLNEIKSHIINLSNYLPIRIISYDIGALLLLVLNDNHLLFETGFTDKSFSISLIENVISSDFKSELVFQSVIEDYYHKASLIIDNALKVNNLVVEGEFDILGVNYYNAVKYQSFLISNYFVMYGDINQPNVLYGNFVIETKKDKILSKIYKY